MPDAAFSREVRRLVGEHAPGWWVAVREQEEGRGAAEPRVEVEIGHPLSDGFSIALGGGPPAIPLTVDSVRRWLTEGSVAWNVEVLATAPESENPEVVKSVRYFAEMFAWTNLEVRAILSILAGAGTCVEKDEHDWLRRTVGEGAPDLPRPNPTPHVRDEYRYRIGR